MSAETKTGTEVSRGNGVVLRAGVLGVVAGLAFGALIQFRLERMGAIGAMYTLGDPSISIGWIAHLLHSALFGLLFGVVVDREALASRAARLLTGVGLGLAYGAVLWAVNIVFLWPLWLNAVGISNAPSVPFLGALPLVGHLVWGGLLGGLFAAVARFG